MSIAARNRDAKTKRKVGSANVKKEVCVLKELVGGDFFVCHMDEKKGLGPTCPC
jgi:hypothetical protein